MAKPRIAQDPGIRPGDNSVVGGPLADGTAQMTGAHYTFKRRLLVVLDIVVVAGVILTVLLLFDVIGKLNNQIIKTQQQVQESHQDVVGSTNRIEGDLKCLQKFFGLPNRQYLEITDLHSCTIKSIPQSSATKQSSSEPVASTSVPVPNLTKTNTSPTIENQQPTNNSNNTNTPGQGNQTSTPTSAPVKVLGIQVCIPLTKVCVDQ